MKSANYSRRQVLRLATPALGGAFLAEKLLAEPSAPERPLFSFGLLGDPQYADVNPSGSRHYRASLGKLKACIARLNQEDLEFVVTVGDIIDRDFASIAPIMKIYEGLKAEHRSVLGNHDFSVDDQLKDQVPAALGMKARYLSDTRKGWRFIRLDGTELAGYAHLQGSPRFKETQKNLQALKESGGDETRRYSYGIGDQQMAWLRRELEDSAAQGQRALVFNHFPALRNGTPVNSWNSKELVALLGEHKHALAYFNGHHHAGRYYDHHGVHYLNVKGMVETPEDTAYSIVKVYDDRLEVHGFGTEPKRDLASR
jgi:predicted phosphodiesterase|tara:strand:- start:769 stop:1707 length:939 start_codon:yes stop_codon:yes gene_type:complete